MAVAAALAAAAILALYLPFLGSTGSVTPGRSTPGCQPQPGYFTIIADHSGFNDSVGHGSPRTPWPTITVRQGSTVRIYVCNLDRVEAHGLAIDHYFDGGVTLRPGDTYKFSFVAGQAGRFTIFCNVFCSVHVYMVGQLVVTA